MDRLLETIKKYEGQSLQTEDGESYSLKLLPPLTNEEIEASEKGMQQNYPPEIRETLLYSRGFEESPIESLDFSGLDNFQDYGDLFPQCLGIAHDGFGNYWILDLSDPACPSGRIYYVAHDPPVVVCQTQSLSHFVEEILKMGQPPYTSEIDTVHEEAASRIWRENPDILSWEQCQSSTDPQLQAFAQRLDATWMICDLRDAKTGMGFSWGRFGPNTQLARHESFPIFAYQRRESWLKRLFGK